MLPHVTPTFPADLENYAPWVAIHGLVAPYGECQCGCGGKARITPMTNRRLGHLAGHPVLYIACHQNGGVRTLAQAFWQWVTPGDPDACWEWQGGWRSSFGYGRFRHKGPQYSAHRVSYELHNGPIPDGLDVLHKCDNPPCCNPAHLFLGDDLANVRDKIAKGRANNRTNLGKPPATAKLSESDVAEILSLRDSGLFQREIAKIFGVDRASISNVLSGKAWKWVAR